MIEVDKQYLRDIFSGDIQFVIPFFQRSYSWDEENWQALWDSVLSVYSGARKKEHFIGSIIVKAENIYSKATQCFVVDGQQRLITLSILLKVLQNEANHHKDKSLSKDINSLLWLQGINEKRIITSHLDQSCYDYIMDSNKHEEIDKDEYRLNRIFKCYKFFQDKISALEEISEADNRLKMRAAITGNSDAENHKSLTFIRVGLSQQDNEQEIFDTVNSYGVDLMVSELIKNFIFREKFWEDRFDAEDNYKQYWQTNFEKYAEDTKWWDKRVNRGREKVSNLEAFLYSFLIITRALESPTKAKRVEFKNMFKEYKKIVTEYHKNNKLEELMKQMHAYAKTYFDNFLDITSKDEMKFGETRKRLFATIGSMNLALADPLILYYYHNFSNKQERDKFSSSLDSYLVRRIVCGVHKVSYGKFFIDALSFIENGEGDFSNFITNVANKNDSFRNPTDSEFKESFKGVYKTNSLPKLLLYSIALKQLSASDNSPVPYKNTVEHLMPKTWQDTPWEDLNMTREEKDIRDDKVRAIGNLTLVRQSLNSSMKNARWSRKKEALQKYCRLPLTKDLLDKEDWTEADIDARTEELFNIAKEIWPNIGK